MPTDKKGGKMIKDILSKECFVGKDGVEENVTWYKIGLLIEDGGKQFVKLFHIPGKVFSVHEQDEKGQA